MGQKFYADPRSAHRWPNGAVGFRPTPPGASFDVLGPYARVTDCPIDGFPGLRLTAYATGHADSYFSVPACTRYRGHHIGGFFTVRDDGVVFVPFDRYRARIDRPTLAP
jgi:hypothetical protein